MQAADVPSLVCYGAWSFIDGSLSGLCFSVRFGYSWKSPSWNELKTRHRREKLLLEKMDKCFDRLSFCTDDPAFDLVSCCFVCFLKMKLMTLSQYLLLIKSFSSVLISVRYATHASFCLISSTKCLHGSKVLHKGHVSKYLKGTVHLKMKT